MSTGIGYCRRLSLAFTFSAYAIGALTGLAVHRGGPRLRKGWPIYLRAQLVATAALLGLFSAWRLTAPHQIVAPIVLAGVGGVLLVAARLIRGPRSTGLAELEGWAAFPNSTFWVLPIAGAVVGPAASAITALTNAVYAVPNAVCIHLMRRDAPIPQRHSTSWLDQSMLVAVGLGLALHLTGPAPAASHWVLVVAGPLLAFVGAALYTGSVFHPHNASVTTDGRGRLALAGTHRHPGRRTWAHWPSSPGPPPWPSSPSSRRSDPRHSTRPNRPCCTATARGW